jgi:hypothetical protein
MPLVKQPLIEPKTAAETVELRVTRNAVGSTIQVEGDLGADEITFNTIGADNVTLTPAFDGNGNAIILTATNPQITFFGRVHLQMIKPITANQVGVVWVR